MVTGDLKRAFNQLHDLSILRTNMGFFTTFWTWLNAQLSTYIGDNTARLASVLEPAVVTLATVYVMAWGYLLLTGKIEEPMSGGIETHSGDGADPGGRIAAVALQHRDRRYLLSCAGPACRRDGRRRRPSKHDRCHLGTRRYAWPAIYGTRVGF